MSYAASLRHSLTFRLNTWYAVALSITFALAVVGTRMAARSAIDGEQQALVARELEQHRLRIQGSGLIGIESFLAERRRGSTLRWFVRIADREGRTLLYDGPSDEAQFESDAMPLSEETRTIRSRGPEAAGAWQLVSTQVTSRLWLQLGVDDSPRRALIARIERSLWLLLAVGLLLAVLGGWWVTRSALAPVRRLAATCRQIVSASDITVRVPVLQGARDELSELSSLFNSVLDRNERLVEGMRQALDNVAHDLRTPLSRLRSGAELALRTDDQPERLRDALADCVEESEQVMDMLRTLMDISEAESGVMQLQLAPVQLSRIVEETVDLYQHIAEQRGVRLAWSAPDQHLVLGDRPRLSRAVANLVDNALKYTDAGGEVSLSVTQSGTRCLLTVEDSGMGIGPEHFDKIWQRLYRSDSSRTRQGLGLGLSFVKAIIEAHGGAVGASSVPGKGSTFTIELPLVTGEREAQRASPS